MAFKMNGFSGFKSNGDPTKVTSARTTGSYKEKDIEKVQGDLQKRFEGDLPQESLDRMKEGHGKNMGDLDRLDKTHGEGWSKGKGGYNPRAEDMREHYRSETGGKMPTKRVKKLNRGKDSKSLQT